MSKKKRSNNRQKNIREKQPWAFDKKKMGTNKKQVKST